MLERAQVRFWAPIVAAAGFFPVLTFLMLGVWYVRLYFTTPVELAAVASIPTVQAPAEAAVVPLAAAVVEQAPVPLAAAVGEPAPVRPAAQSPEPLTTMSMVDAAHSANFHPTQNASPAELPAMSPEPLAPEFALPMTFLVPPVQAQIDSREPLPEQDPVERMSEAPASPSDEKTSALPPDEKASEFASALPMFATFAVAPPMQFTVEKPVPLPRPKPKVVRVNRPAPLPPPPAGESSPLSIAPD